MTNMGGTPEFMAPECCRGEGKRSPAVDVYAFGVTVARLLTLRDIYPRGLSPFQLMCQVLAPPCPPPASPSPPSCVCGHRSLRAEE